MAPAPFTHILSTLAQRTVSARKLRCKEISSCVYRGWQGSTQARRENPESQVPRVSAFTVACTALQRPLANRTEKAVGKRQCAAQDAGTQQWHQGVPLGGRTMTTPHTHRVLPSERPAQTRHPRSPVPHEHLQRLRLYPQPSLPSHRYSRYSRVCDPLLLSGTCLFPTCPSKWRRCMPPACWVKLTSSVLP